MSKRDKDDLKVIVITTIASCILLFIAFYPYVILLNRGAH